MQLNQLSGKQLKQVISDASSALYRRQRIEKAISEVQRVAKKYQLDKTELQTVVTSLRFPKTRTSDRVKGKGQKVRPKYRSTDGSKTWTGRGRTPIWVVEICERENLTVEDFKSNGKFLV